MLQLEDGQLVVSTPNQLRKWACDLVRNLVLDDVDLADELIQEWWQAAAVIGYAVDRTAPRGVRPRLIGATDKANG